jgi:DNA-binding NarL/FixJ family response regulator
MPLRVIVLSDGPALRDRVIAEVDAIPDAIVVAAGDPDAGALRDAPADVAVWDLGGDISDARAQIARARDLGLPVLVLGPSALTVEALAAGAGGFVRRGIAGHQLRAALEAVAQGLRVTDEADAAEAGEFLADRSEDAPAEELTPREMDVLQLLAEGLPNKEIARRLGISEHTVKFHVTTILAKFDAHTRTEAVTRAARQGFIIL